MLKKILMLSVVSIAAAGTAHANHDGTHHSYYNSGFLVGAHIGASFGSTKFDNQFEDGVANTPISPNSGTKKKTAFVGGVLGGYRYVFHNGVTLSGDLTLSFMANQKMAINLKHQTSPFYSTLKRNFSITPAIKIGKVFAHRYHVYLGLGVGFSKFDLSAHNVNGNRSLKTSKTKIAFTPSLGLEYALCRHWSVTADVSYEIFQKVNNRFNDELLVGLPGGYYDSSAKPRFITARLGVTYKF